MIIWWFYWIFFCFFLLFLPFFQYMFNTWESNYFYAKLVVYCHWLRMEWSRLSLFGRKHISHAMYSVYWQQTQIHHDAMLKWRILLSYTNTYTVIQPVTVRYTNRNISNFIVLIQSMSVYGAFFDRIDLEHEI